MKLKKPKFWDYKNPNIYAYLLYPLSFLINLINQIKINTPKKKFKIKTICIGNFYVGGTGKTSLSLKIKEILNRQNIKSCFIKKIYSDQVDEQNILRNKGDLFLAKKRSEALQKAEDEKYEFAILDDGLQDKTLKYDVSIVCFNNINWIGNGMTFPSGPLRESLENIKNYKHIFLNGNLENLEFLKREILSINSEINIYVGKYEATNIDEFNKNNNYLVFSGIGNHKTFISMVKNYGLKIIKDLEFADHYQYSNKDINKIIDIAKNLDCKIITTEKDYLRLKDKDFNEIKYIKSNLKILNEDEFIKSIIK